MPRTGSLARQGLDRPSSAGGAAVGTAVDNSCVWAFYIELELELAMFSSMMQDAMNDSNLQQYCQGDCIVHNSQRTTAHSNTQENAAPGN